MKNKISIKTVFGSLALVSAFIMTPMVFAADATTTSSVRINGDGIVQVTNAEITSISGNIINAITRFKNNIATWVFVTNASTTIATNNSVTASTTNPMANINIGDRLNVTGVLATFGSVISVNATKIKDITSLVIFGGKSGTVQSVSTSTGTFVINSNNKLITVQTNASTTFSLTGTSTPLTLDGLILNSKVRVMGTASSDGASITATSVIVKTMKIDNDTDSKGEKNDKTKSNNGSTHGLKNGQKAKEDRTNPGEHKGFLKTNVSLELKTGDR